MKRCSKCRKDKLVSCFDKSITMKDSLQGICKTCKSKINKEYRLKNKEYFKDYHENYYDKNREEIIRIQILNNKRRRNKFPIIKVIDSVRNQTKYRLNKIINNKSFEFNKLLGCDSETFKKHLESKFRNGQNFNNRNTQQLDHIIPLQLGGTNAEDNLQLIPIAIWKANTPIENHLGRLLKERKITGDEAKRLILDFKEGRIDAQSILNRN